MYSHKIICATSAVIAKSSPTQDDAPLEGRGGDQAQLRPSLLILIFGFGCGLLNCLAHNPCILSDNNLDGIGTICTDSAYTCAFQQNKAGCITPLSRYRIVLGLFDSEGTRFFLVFH